MIWNCQILNMSYWRVSQFVPASGGRKEESWKRNGRVEVLAEKNQTLEMQKNRLLDSLVHMVQGFEVIVGDKKETIQDQEGKIVDLEALVEESLDKELLNFTIGEIRL